MSDRPPSDSGERPEEPRRRQDPSGSGTEPSFGSFVSDSVRRSAGRFRSDLGDMERRSRRSTSRLRASGTSRPAYRTGGRRRAERDEEPQPLPRDDEPEGYAAEAGRPAWLQDAIDRAGGPERAIAAVAVLVVAVIALIWLLVAVLGDDGGGGGGDGTSTEVLQVVPIGESGTPGADREAGSTPGSGPSRAIVTPTPPPNIQPTPTVRGSDNTLDQIGGSPQAGAPDAEVACRESCLARVERTPDAEQVLARNGTRPSYAGEGWYWVVAEPDEVAAISAELTTVVVREGSETLNLYMVELPSPQDSDAAAAQLGTVIDSVDAYRLVEAESVPANVRPVLDAGLVVEKVAPAPPEEISRIGSRPELKEGDIWGLMGEVDPGRIEAAIVELQGSGATDGSGVGTRHYTSTGNQIAAEYLYRELESYGLNVWYEDFVSWDGLLLVNVVGEIPGRDESRLYGVMAHFDTTSDTPRTVAPGADDNASGVAATLEIARILSGYDVKHPLRVIFVNYEEEGVVGSQEFARDAKQSGDPWEGIFNVDSVGSARNGSQIILNALGESTWMEDLIVRVNEAYGVGERLEVLQSAEIVADDNRLRDQGLESVLIARELYGWSPVHHTPNDVIDSVSIPHTQSAATLVLLTVASLLV